jgi:hypothetical protein
MTMSKNPFVKKNGVDIIKYIKDNSPTEYRGILNNFINNIIKENIKRDTRFMNMHNSAAYNKMRLTKHENIDIIETNKDEIAVTHKDGNKFYIKFNKSVLPITNSKHFIVNLTPVITYDSVTHKNKYINDYLKILEKNKFTYTADILDIIEKEKLNYYIKIKYDDKNLKVGIMYQQGSYLWSYDHMSLFKKYIMTKGIVPGFEKFEKEIKEYKKKHSIK